MTATFKRLRATNTLTYRELDVPLDNQGLVLITAKNKDTNGSNGSGKSNIWEMLCHLIFGTTGKGLNKKGIINQFVGKDMLVELDLEVNGTPYTFVEARKHKKHGTGFQVLENGNDITPKRSAGKNEPQLLMQEIIGFSLPEYLGMVYLCQKFNHVLVKGTRSEKQAYLSALFDLDKYEVLHKEAKERSKQVEKDMAGYQSYERDLERCNETLANIPDTAVLTQALNDSTTIISQKKEERTLLTQEITKLRAANQQAQRKVDALSALNDLNFAVISEEAFQTQRTAVEANLTKVRQTIKSLELMIEKLKHREKVQSQIPAPPTLSQQELLDTAQQLRSSIPTKQLLIQQIEERNRIAVQLEQFKTQREAYPPPEELDASLAKLREENATVKAQVREAEFALRAATEAKKSLDDITGSVCPTCHRGISPEEKDLLITGLGLPEKQASYDTLSQQGRDLVAEEAQVVQQKLAVDKIFEEEKRLLERYVTLPTDILEEVQEALQENQEALQTAENRLQIWSTIETLNAQLANLPEGDIAMNEAVLVDFQEQKAAYKNEGDILNKVSIWIRDANLDTDDLTGDEVLQEKQGILEDLTTQIEDLIKEQTVVQGQLRERHEVETLKQTAEEMLQEASALRPRQIYLPKLVDAFGPKGLKTVRLDIIMQQLVKILPHYLNPLFSGSGYKVSVGKNLEFELSMQHEGKRIVLPGKGTSGGEAKSLDMANLFALRTLRTSHKSANILIVDEPYGDLDAGKRGILTDLFQQLRATEAVSSVFVITHESEVLQHSFDKVWTVVRENNESKLKV